MHTLTYSHLVTVHVKEGPPHSNNLQSSSNNADLVQMLVFANPAVLPTDKYVTMYAAPWTAASDHITLIVVKLLSFHSANSPSTVHCTCVFFCDMQVIAKKQAITIINIYGNTLLPIN